MIVQVYVDNVIFDATLDSLCEKFAKLMESEFKMSMMGELNFFLELQVKYVSNGTMICQQKIIEELLKRYNKVKTKPIDTPIGNSTKIVVDELCPPVSEILYRGIIVSLLYLTTSTQILCLV